MLSLYIHVPFCDKKCGYCSFFVVPREWIDPQEKMIAWYIAWALRDIEKWGKQYNRPELKTLYFGGGTPGILGKQRLIELIDAVAEHFDLTYLEELSIELNPNPYEEILDLVQTLNTTYKDLPRIRYSFGIQSFDDSVLNLSWRQYSFIGIQNFLRELRHIKDARNVFNLDFIAFGKGQWTKDDEYLFRDKARREWFEQVAQSWFIDSYSLYTLELFAWSQWEKTKRKEIDWQSHLDLSHVPFETDQEKITTEFQWLKEVILDAWYRRYELSNFAMPWKESIHNMIYRNMWSYIGIGPSASSYLTGKYAEWIEGIWTHGIRFTESTSIFWYTKESKKDPESIITMNEREYLIEKLFLTLRTNRGADTLSWYESTLVSGWEKMVEQYIEAGLVIYENDRLTLTDEGLDVYNALVSELIDL